MRVLVPALLSLVLSGCFHIASTITVRPDGSALIEDRVELSGLGADALMEESEDKGVDKAALRDRAAALGEGVTLVGVKESDSGYTALYSVADVRALRFTSPDLDLGDDSDAKTVADESLDLRFEFEEGQPATLRLVVGGPAGEAPEAAADTLTEAERAEAARGLRMARALLGDARISVDVVVEGEIVDTDADYVEGSAVTVYDVHFDTLFDVIEEHPELMGRDEPPTREIMALVGEREGFRVQSPGTVAVRFE